MRLQSVWFSKMQHRYDFFLEKKRKKKMVHIFYTKKKTTNPHGL